MHYTDMVMTVSCWRLESGWELLVWTVPLVYPGGGSNCWPSTAGCIVFAQGVGGDLSRRENPMNTWVAGATCVSSGAPVEGYPPFDTWMGVTRCTSTTGKYTAWSQTVDPGVVRKTCIFDTGMREMAFKCVILFCPVTGYCELVTKV